MGTLITKSPLNLDDHDIMVLGEGDIDYFGGRTLSIDAFVRECGIDTKPRTGRTTRSIYTVEFSDEFVGDCRHGYHVSFDGAHLMQDGEHAIFDKRLQTDKFVYFAYEDEDVMFSVTPDGGIDELIADNYFADVGLLESLESIVTRDGTTKAIYMDDFTRGYLPQMAKEFDWHAPGKDATHLTYYDIETQGARALFTEHTLSLKSIPKALHVYELDSDPANTCAELKLSKHAYVNFSGTLITERPLDLGEMGHTFLDLKDISLRSVTPITLKDFAREVGIRIKSPKDRER